MGKQLTHIAATRLLISLTSSSVEKPDELCDECPEAGMMIVARSPAVRLALAVKLLGHPPRKH